MVAGAAGLHEPAGSPTPMGRARAGPGPGLGAPAGQLFEVGRAIRQGAGVVPGLRGILQAMTC